MSSPVWKTAIPTIEYRVCSTVVGVVAPGSASPAATSPIPPHCRRWSWNPKRRSASTASTTKPPAITACATERGASAMAPTWNTQPTTATAHPIAHHFDRNSSVALLSGARRLTAGAATAPRCFHRNPRFVAMAVATANTSPMSSRSSIVPSREAIPPPSFWVAADSAAQTPRGRGCWRIVRDASARPGGCCTKLRPARLRRCRDGAELHRVRSRAGAVAAAEREWLPADHLAWFVLDAVDAMDLKAFFAGYRDDGWGALRTIRR